MAEGELQFRYDDNPVEIVTNLTFLGVTLNRTEPFKPAMQLAEKATKASYIYVRSFKKRRTANFSKQFVKIVQPILLMHVKSRGSLNLLRMNSQLL